MPLTLSIDNFIDAHRGDIAVERCGKLAISQVILDSERKSKLYTDINHERSLDIRKLAGAWYPKLFQLLSEGVDKNTIKRVFENASFIAFNYDRCLEHFLCEALKCYYAIEGIEAQELVTGMRVVHPYGTVGHLRWQDSSGLSFGAEVNGQKLLQISAQLRTFTEQVTDEAARKKIAEIIGNADNLVFLGFAFHDQNMALLKSSQPPKDRLVLATALGVSESDCGVIKDDICSMLNGTFKPRNSNPQHTRIEIRNDLKCVDLFDQYWRSPRAA